MLDGIDLEILIWLVAGLLSGVGEVLTGTLFLWPFAIGALAAAVVAAMGAELFWVVTVFFVVTLLVLAIVFRLAISSNSEPPATREGAHRYVDALGLVTAEIAAPAAGRIRVGTESWRALSRSGELIDAGVEVTVVAVRGNALVVEPRRSS